MKPESAQSSGPESYTELIPDIVSAASRKGFALSFRETLEKRLLVEQALTSHDRAKGKGENWVLMGGDYPKEEVEQISSRIMRLLSARNDGAAPVIALDFGGGYGQGFMEVASRFKKEIENGELVLLVSNLGYVPPETKDDAGYTGAAASLRASRDEDGDRIFPKEESWDFAEEHQGLVKFIQGNAMEILSSSVEAGGKTYPLAGNVGLIFENHAVMHSQVPDMALSIFGELLQRDGELFLESVKPNYMNTPIRPVTTADGAVIKRDGAYSDAVREGLEVGLELLKDKYRVEDTGQKTHNHSVFRKT